MNTIPVLSDPPSWVYPNAIVDLDFVNNRYYAQGIGSSLGIFTMSGGANGTTTDITGTIVTASAPRFDYDITTKAPKGLLSETQRTNLLLWSGDFSNAAWTKVNTTVTANSALAPDGTMSGTTFAAISASLTNWFQQITASATTTPYSVRIRIQAGTVTTGALSIYDFTSSLHITASARIVSGPGSVSISSSIALITGLVAGQWTDIEIVSSAPTSGHVLRFYGYVKNTSVANPGDSLLYWGGQCENAAFSTSYIPTTSTQVTRTGDKVTLVNAPVSPVESSFVITYDFGGVSTNLSGNGRIALSLANATATNVYNIVMYNQGGDTAGLYSQSDGGVAAGASWPSGVIDNNGGTHKMALSWQTTSWAVGVDGTMPTSGTWTNPMNTNITMGIGGQVTAIGQICGHIKRVGYWGIQVPNAQLNTYTS